RVVLVEEREDPQGEDRRDPDADHLHRHAPPRAGDDPGPAAGPRPGLRASRRSSQKVRLPRTMKSTMTRGAIDCASMKRVARSGVLMSCSYSAAPVMPPMIPEIWPERT